ncbi:CDPK-related kinase 5 [Capsicum baccatum]|uniref:CDPK-related kinase 5 n=1 Tax=Capsicum baccatum TaxID=33114 RepID=A0A2G2XQJ8_CAPBA|nr:CDPK-related kinase 5 [Capsicum baccatum]
MIFELLALLDFCDEGVWICTDILNSSEVFELWAKHIKALLARRHDSIKPNEATVPEVSECDIGLDKNFGYSKNFDSHYELEEEVGRGHFG